MAVLWFFKWTLQLLLNLTKGAKFAGSVGHPMTKMLSASGGFAPGPHWGLCPQTPIRHGAPPNHWPLPPPMNPTELCPGTSNRKSAPMVSYIFLAHSLCFFLVYKCTVTVHNRHMLCYAGQSCTVKSCLAQFAANDWLQLLINQSVKFEHRCQRKISE